MNIYTNHVIARLNHILRHVSAINTSNDRTPYTFVDSTFQCYKCRQYSRLQYGIQHHRCRSTTAHTTVPTVCNNSSAINESHANHTSKAPTPTSASTSTPTTAVKHCTNDHNLSKSLTGKILSDKQHITAVSLLPAKLSQYADNLTVVLDMDETMIHSQFASDLYYSDRACYDRYMQYGKCHTNNIRQSDNCNRVYEFHANDRPYDLMLDIHFESDHSHELIFVHVRPHIREFLQYLQSHNYEVVVFTAALSDYANAVLDVVDTTRSIQYRLYRQHTVKYNDLAYVKDLSRIGRDLSRTVIIDNNELAFTAQPDNGIHITDYYGLIEQRQQDTELLHIQSLIHQLNKFNDVRPIIHQLYQHK